ncbi:MAG: hypothetical protein ABGX27_08835 [Desulfurobacteriaceae bacterium]
MNFERIKKEIETKDLIVIKALLEILEVEEKKIGLQRPKGIKDDIRKIFDRWGKEYDPEES